MTETPNPLERRIVALDAGYSQVPFPAALVDRMTDLVADIEVDLDSPLT